MGYDDLYFGSSKACREALALCEDLAPTPFTLLLLGATGVGKTAFALHAHQLSRRRGEFVEKSLAEVPEELRHAMLAGHVKGAYTGAVESRAGWVEQARGGTLFLDELQLASASVQSDLLQLLDRDYVVRLRDTVKRYVDVRYIFATHQEPRDLRARGVWGDDFFYRLGFNYIRLPSLTERPDDILPLAERLLGRSLAVLGKEWKPRFAPEVELLLLQYPWPGNIRELAMVCQYAAARLREDRPIQLRELPPDVLVSQPAPPTPAYDLREEQVDRVLRDVQGNKSAAARRLEISRQSLGRLLKRRDRGATNGDRRST
jgi:two-component system response regulator HydG